MNDSQLKQVDWFQQKKTSHLLCTLTFEFFASNIFKWCVVLCPICRGKKNFWYFIFAKVSLNSLQFRWVLLNIYDVIFLVLALASIQHTCSNSYKNNNCYCKIRRYFIVNLVRSFGRLVGLFKMWRSSHFNWTSRF